MLKTSGSPKRTPRLTPAIMLTILIAASAATAQQAIEIFTIVPGEGIGPARLGMTSTQVQAAISRLPCEIDATYSAGRSSRLETNCGVAFQTAEGITVGLGGLSVRRVFGMPDQLVPDNRPPGTRADWVIYRGHGIAFRLIHTTGDALIQAIAIFPGTGPPRRPGPFPTLPPLPGPPD